MGDFFKTNKFKIIIALVALMFGMMLYSASRDGLSNIPKNLLSMVTTPVQKVTAALSDYFENHIERFKNSKKNAQENETLKTEIADLKKQLIDYEKLKDENEQLKEIAGIKDIYPDFQTTIASVVSRDPSDRYGSFIIDRGYLHDVAVKDPVITKNGVIGIVTDVGPISARVKTILSPDTGIGVYEITSKELGIVNGETSLASKGMTKMTILGEHSTLKAGQIVVTAGSSGLYPKGLPVGTITEIQDEDHGVNKYALIEPTEKIDDINTVHVITNFKGQGSELIKY